MTPPPSRPPVLRRPRQPVPTSLSTAEDGAAAPLNSPFPTPSPSQWNYPPSFPPHGPPPSFPNNINNTTAMEMRSSSRFNEPANESTVPLLMPMPFVPVVGPSPRRETTPPLVDVSSMSSRPTAPQYQDGSDGVSMGTYQQPSTHASSLASTAGDGLAGLTIPATTASHSAQTHPPQPPQQDNGNSNR